MDNQIVVSNNEDLDKVLKEEWKFAIEIVKKIINSGANVLLIQKSILRDAISDIASHFLAKKNIMVIKNIDREEEELICKAFGCKPIAHIDYLTSENLGSAEVAEELLLSDGSKVF